MRRLFSTHPMKPHLLLAAMCAVVLAGCDQKNAQVEDLARQNAELQARIAEQERAGKLRAAEEAAAAQTAANDAMARQLAAERDALAADKEQLTAEQRKTAEAELRRRESALKEEQRRTAAERDMAVQEAADAREQARLAEEAQAREQADARAQGQRARLDMFYDALDPHGDWFEVEGHGFVFQPRTANARGWRPYTDGEWVWTEQGWTWKSNEPFGWATYHYGRWARLSRRGWVWVPGSEWAPAWVAWRRSEQFIGWAPLPPEAHSPGGFNSAVDEYYDIGAGSYVFVPRREFGGEPTYLGRVVAPERNVTIIEDTVNVTNLSYRVVNQKNVLVNEGPDFAAINAASAQPVPRLRLQRRDTREPAPARVENGVLEMVAPVLAHMAAQSRPKAPKQKEAPEVDRGWGGMQPEAAQKLRGRNAAEARETEVKQRAAKQEPPKVRATPAPATPAPVVKATPVPPPATPEKAPATPMRRLPKPEAATPMPVEKATPMPVEKTTPAPVPATPMPAKPDPEKVAPTPEIPAATPVRKLPRLERATPSPVEKATPWPARKLPPAATPMPANADSEKAAAPPEAPATTPAAPVRRRVVVSPSSPTPPARMKDAPVPATEDTQKGKIPSRFLVPPPTTPEGERAKPQDRGRVIATPAPVEKPTAAL